MAASAMCVRETPLIKTRGIYTKHTINQPKRIIRAYILPESAQVVPLVGHIMALPVKKSFLLIKTAFI